MGYCRENLHVYHSWELKGLADKLIPLDSLSMQENEASFSFVFYELAKITFT